MVRILVVDDEEDVVDVVSAFLEREGYDAENALSGLEALKVLERVKVDLVLLDLMMPDMHGFEVCKKIQNNPKTSNVPIIVVTAKGDLEHIEKAYKCSLVKSYIAKPFEKEVLLKTVAEVLETGKAGVSEKKKTPTIKDEAYKEIIENYPDGIALLDHENTVLYVNSAFEATTGLTRNELVGRGDLPKLIKPQDERGNMLLVSDAFRACFCDDPTSTATFNILNKKGVKLRVVSTVFKTKSKITVIVLRNITKD